MRYFIYILLMGALFSQDIQGDDPIIIEEPKTYTFTEEEVLGFTNTIKELELKDSLKTIVTDSKQIRIKC